MKRLASRLLAAASVMLAVAACNDPYASNSRSIAPVPPQTIALMSAKGMAKSDPILVRLYKKESELEIWKKAADGKYAHLKTYPICRWSGQLGPKQREGDRQAPEGFYTITPGLMNPNSAYYLSFDTGYPNAFDRDHGRTGSQLMVHGTCSSRGCYAMTDEGIAEVYAIAREAFAGGQKGFQFQAYPFRMTAENLTKFRRDPNMPFWANLKEGSDHFEITKREPKVAVCSGRYAFDTVGDGCAPDPSLQAAVAEKEAGDRQAVAELVSKGVPAVRVTYVDGGGHESFRTVSAGSAAGSDSQLGFGSGSTRASLGDVSRPDALAAGPQEVAWEDGKRAASSRSAVLVAAAARRTPASKLASSPDESGPDAPVAAAPSRKVVVASAEGAMPGPAAASLDKPFYERMVASVTSKPEPTEVPAIAAPQSVAARSVVPVTAPPRHQVASASKGVPSVKVDTIKASPKPDPKGDGKPQASKQHGGSERGKQAALAPGKASGAIPGGSPIGPVASAFTTKN